MKEKENLEYKLSVINKAQKQVQSEDSKKLVLDISPWSKDILWQIANIIRTSPIVNLHYPHGYDCGICRECGCECTTDRDGIDCNWAFMEYFEKELRNRGYYEGK